MQSLLWVPVGDEVEGDPDVERWAEAAAQSGCRQLGRVLAAPDDVAERWTKHLPDEQGRAWDAAVRAPMHLLVTPDGTGVLEASGFWRAAAVRVLTALTDGSAVETLLAWPETPPWPGTLAHAHHRADLAEEMMRNAAPGRSVRWIPRGSVPELLAAHRVHVQEVASARGTSPLPVRRLDDAMDLVDRCFVHARRVSNRIALVIYVLSTAVILGAGVGCWIAGTAWWVTVLAVLWATGVAFVSQPRWFVVFSYVRWYRPAFPSAT